eukprot:TRINITY_DN17374_c0_g1_i1.p1 TRINITY_DN17374_c0_g1~~TRINITY_DN17374_c0_g1_i1.p1  ORF type:complete len:943 (-),score=250.01 TRINITY_DN17374_c0_g1_i1:26-2617(-)
MDVLAAAQHLLDELCNAGKRNYNRTRGESVASSIPDELWLNPPRRSFARSREGSAAGTLGDKSPLNQTVLRDDGTLCDIGLSAASMQPQLQLCDECEQRRRQQQYEHQHQDQDHQESDLVNTVNSNSKSDNSNANFEKACSDVRSLIAARKLSVVDGAAPQHLHRLLDDAVASAGISSSYISIKSCKELLTIKEAILRMEQEELNRITLKQSRQGTLYLTASSTLKADADLDEEPSKQDDELEETKAKLAAALAQKCELEEVVQHALQEIATSRKELQEVTSKTAENVRELQRELEETKAEKEDSDAQLDFVQSKLDSMELQSAATATTPTTATSTPATTAAPHIESNMPTSLATAVAMTASLEATVATKGVPLENKMEDTSNEINDNSNSSDNSNNSSNISDNNSKNDNNNSNNSNSNNSDSSSTSGTIGNENGKQALDIPKADAATSTSSLLFFDDGLRGDTTSLAEKTASFISMKRELEEGLKVLNTTVESKRDEAYRKLKDEQKKYRELQSKFENLKKEYASVCQKNADSSLAIISFKEKLGIAEVHLDQAESRLIEFESLLFEERSKSIRLKSQLDIVAEEYEKMRVEAKDSKEKLAAVECKHAADMAQLTEEQNLRHQLQEEVKELTVAATAAAASAAASASAASGEAPSYPTLLRQLRKSTEIPDDDDEEDVFDFDSLEEAKQLANTANEECMKLKELLKSPEVARGGEDQRRQMRKRLLQAEKLRSDREKHLEWLMEGMARKPQPSLKRELQDARRQALSSKAKHDSLHERFEKLKVESQEYLRQLKSLEAERKHLIRRGERKDKLELECRDLREKLLKVQHGGPSSPPRRQLRSTSAPRLRSSSTLRSSCALHS